MQTCASQHQWYALRTAAGREKAVAAQLRNKGFEDFLPLYRSRRKWSDRIKELELPLFPGYLFCRFDHQNRLPILVTPGVKLIVGYGKIAVPVTEPEIESLRRAVASGAPAMPWPYLSVGQRVRIREGSLSGVEGVLIQLKSSWRIVLSVELLRRSVAVELDRDAVAPLALTATAAECARLSQAPHESAMAASKSAV